MILTLPNRQGKESEKWSNNRRMFAAVVADWISFRPSRSFVALAEPCAQRIGYGADRPHCAISSWRDGGTVPRGRFGREDIIFYAGCDSWFQPSLPTSHAGGGTRQPPVYPPM